MSDLTEAMLAVKTAPGVKNDLRTAGTTVEVSGDRATVEFAKKDGEDTDTAAYRFLKAKGEDAADWEVTGFRSTEWTMPNGEIGESIRYTFARRKVEEEFGYDVEEQLAWLEEGRGCPPRVVLPRHGDPQAGLFLIGDTQFGKMDGDGVDGTLARFVRYVDEATRLVALQGEQVRFTDFCVGFTGDHGEGFVSQNGANIWRTRLTNAEQMRLTRRCMMYAVEQFARALPLNVTLHTVAIPGNHGDTMRVNGKGVTKYNDNWDTEALVAVADAVALSDLPVYRRCKFYVPEDDEMTVVLDLAGTRVGFMHGHQHKPGKHFEWLAGQALNKKTPLRDVDLLVEGHLHHYHQDTRNGVTFIGVPAVESESTWFRHRTGITGDPGALLVVTSGGKTWRTDVIR